MSEEHPLKEHKCKSKIDKRACLKLWCSATQYLTKKASVCQFLREQDKLQRKPGVSLTKY